MLTAGTCEPDPHLVEFCDRFCMSRTITEPTRVTNCSISLTDLLITGSPERFAFSGTMKLGLNDHDLIYTIWKQEIARTLPKFIEYRSMQGFEKDCYLADLSKIPWDSANIYDDIDDIYEHWHHLFIRVVDQHLPLKRKDIRGDQPPWITPEISAISRRNILFKKFKRNKSADNWEQFKKQRNLVTTFKRKSMKSYFIQASAECAHLGEFWKNSSLYYLPKVLNNNIYKFWRKDGWLLTT